MCVGVYGWEGERNGGGRRKRQRKKERKGFKRENAEVKQEISLYYNTK